MTIGHTNVRYICHLLFLDTGLLLTSCRHMYTVLCNQPIMCLDHIMFDFSATAPQWARASSFTRFLDHTQRRTTLGLLWTSDQFVAETFYLTTHNTHNRQTSMSPVGFEPTISAGERPLTYALDRAATGTVRPYYVD